MSKLVLYGRAVKTLPHTSLVSMYYRSNQDASQQGHHIRLLTTIALRMARWDVLTIAKRSEEGSVETECFAIKK